MNQLKKDIFIESTLMAGLSLFAVSAMTSISLGAIGHIIFSLGVLTSPFHSSFSWPKRSDLSMSFFSLIAIMAVIIMSVIVNWSSTPSPIKAISKIKYFFIPLLGVVSFKGLGKRFWKEKRVKLLISLFTVATVIATLSGLIGLATGLNPLKMKASCHATRACGLFGMYMTYGYGISLCCSLFAGLYFKRSKIKRITSSKILLPAFVISFIGLFLSYTRGGLLSFLGTLPFFFFKKHRKTFLLMGLFATLGLGASFTFIPKVQKMFLERTGSNQQRISFYKAALYAAKESPVLGLGHRNFEGNSIRIKKENKLAFTHFAGHAHNNILEFLASTGVLGALFFILFSLSWAREAYISKFFLSETIFVFALNFIVSGMFQYTFGDGENLILIMAVWMLSQIVLKEQSTETETNETYRDQKV